MKKFLEEHHLEVSLEARKELQEALDREDKRRRRYRYLLTFLAILCIGSFGYSLMIAVNASRENTSSLRDQEVTRIESRTQLCKLLNSNARQNNKQTDAINNIILSSVKASRSFESTYKSLGLPPYSERLATAQKSVDSLNKTKVKILDCVQFAYKGSTLKPPKRE